MVTVTCHNVHVSLGRREVVRNLSTRLEGGALIGIVGPNGAGKSTLVRAILGLAPLSAGAVSIDGTPVQQMDQRSLARQLAYLPQGQTLHWPLTVHRLVALGRLPHLSPLSRMSADDTAMVESAMHRAHVAHLHARNVLELSGGERARVLLTRALAVGAEGLVVDEPLASLDPGHQIDVMELLAAEARQGALVLAVLHDLTMAARYCDRVLLLQSGECIADGPPADVLTRDNLARVYGIDAFISGMGTGSGSGSGDKSRTPLIVPLDRIAPASTKDIA